MTGSMMKSDSRIVKGASSNKGMSHRREQVALVFQRDAVEVRMMIKGFVAEGSSVIAITKQLDLPMEKFLLQQKHVTVKVVDTTSLRELSKAIRGSDRAVLETKYWEQFASAKEEEQALKLLAACHVVGISNCLFNTVEDTRLLREMGLESQIVPDAQGRVHPTFDGMQDIKRKAHRLRVHLNHMITSYVDTEISRRSLCLISGENGKIISVPFYGAPNSTMSGDETETSSVCSMSSDEGIANIPKSFFQGESSDGSVFGRCSLTRVDIHWMLGLGLASFLLFQADFCSLGKEAILNNEMFF